MINLQEETLLTSANSTGAGTKYDARRSRGWTFYIVASSVTSGATIDIEVEYGDDAWKAIHSETVTADGTTVIQSEHGHYKRIRANITAYTDGTYNVFAQGSTKGL